MPRKTSSYLVILPNSVVHHINLSKNSTGMDCLEKVCSLLGIVEVDYFGLKYFDHRGICLWLNLRMKIMTQVKHSSKPYQLYFRVKYFIDPVTIQQPTTRHLFYIQVKALMSSGQLPVPSKESPKIGALIAQRELGNCNNIKDKFCYPQYFKEWAPGIARGIAKEHSVLSGLSPLQAETKFLDEAFKLENWGVSYVKAANTEDESQVYVGIGGFHIRLCDSKWKMIKKISYEHLSETSFHNKTFTILYNILSPEGEVTDRRLNLRCSHHGLARYLFRHLTEDHTFFSHETVSTRVLGHFRSQPLKDFCEKFFGRSYDHVYHFDVVRTKYEAYSRAWERLHQVNQEELTSNLSQNVLEDSTSDLTRSQIRVDDNHSNLHAMESAANSEINNIVSADISQMDLVRFIGLSKSSCDIAKELLESPQKTVRTESIIDSSHAKRLSPTTSSENSVCLTQEGTVKLGKFIQKIVDSKLCRICMDNPVSAVFCPCGHLISCYKCSLQCTKCPLCRSCVAYVQYVYGTGL